MPLSKIKPDPDNPKDHDLGALQQSMDRFGYVAPMILNERTGTLLAGHGRLKELIALRADKQSPPEGIRVKNGEWLAPVVMGVRLGAQAGKAYTIADNRMVELGGWDEPRLVDALISLSNGNLDGTGYDRDDVDQLIRLYRPELLGPEPPEPEIDRAAELQKKWGTELGQLWQIGEHRLICGDCRDSEVVATVMAGNEYAALVTSPPYPGVAVWEEMWHGLSIEECHDWLAEAYAAWMPLVARKCNWIINTGDNTSNQWNDWWTVQKLERLGIKLIQRCIWYRNGWVPAGTSQRRLLQVHEWVLWLTPNVEFNAPWDEIDGLASTMFAQPWDRERLHETPFPVELIERWLTIWTMKDDQVLDPFVGSGTTLVGCEQLGRKGRGIEISPAYVAVSLERLNQMGLKPKLVSA